MNLDIQIAKTRKQRQMCYRLRHEVFVEEQAVPVELEIDEHDETDAIHYLGQNNGTPVAAARIVIASHQAKIGRLVILQPFRGNKWGEKMLRFMIDDMKNVNAVNSIALDAQIYATGFYEKFGFSCEGSAFLDAGIEHIRMTLSLNS